MDGTAGGYGTHRPCSRAARAAALNVDINRDLFVLVLVVFVTMVVMVALVTMVRFRVALVIKNLLHRTPLENLFEDIVCALLAHS